jgi:hypothetical protein
MITAAALALAVAAAGPAAASAPATQPNGSQVEAAVAAITSVTGTPQASLSAGQARQVGAATVTPGNSLAAGVTVAANDQSLSVRQPAAVGRAASHPSGLLVSATSQPGTTAAAQAVKGGVQLFTVLDGREAPSTFRYELTLPDGARLTPTTAGGFRIAIDGIAYGEIAPPWAVDATGRSLPTSYTTTDGVLVQHIDHSEATYPIVADPSISFGWNIYVTWSKSEVRTLKEGWGWAHGLATAVCATVPDATIKAGCVVAVLVHAVYIYDVFTRAYNQGECVQYKFSYGAPPQFRSAYVYDC